LREGETSHLHRANIERERKALLSDIRNEHLDEGYEALGRKRGKNSERTCLGRHEEEQGCLDGS